MIQAFNNERVRRTNKGPHTIPDVIVTQCSEEEKIEADGTRIIKPLTKRINLTKKINETAKSLKRDTTIDIDQKLNEVFELKKAEIKKEISNKLK